MCNGVNIKVETQGLLSDVLGVDLAELGYTGDDDCLCPIDVDAAIKMAGHEFVRDDCGDYYIEEQHNDRQA